MSRYQNVVASREGRGIGARLRHDAENCRIMATLPDAQVAALHLEAACKLGEAAELLDRARERQRHLWGVRDRG